MQSLTLHQSSHQAPFSVFASLAQSSLARAQRASTEQSKRALLHTSTHEPRKTQRANQSTQTKYQDLDGNATFGKFWVNSDPSPAQKIFNNKPRKRQDLALRVCGFGARFASSRSNASKNARAKRQDPSASPAKDLSRFAKDPSASLASQRAQKAWQDNKNSQDLALRVCGFGARFASSRFSASKNVRAKRQDLSADQGSTRPSQTKDPSTSPAHKTPRKAQARARA